MGPCSTDTEILELKAAVWALGHISSSVYGAQWARQQGVTKALVNLTQKCPVYSVRATAFYALALTATNCEGADTLRTLGKMFLLLIISIVIIIIIIYIIS